MYLKLLSILLTSLALCSSGQAQTLNILIWDAYLSDETIAAWESRSGATINQILFDRDEVRNSMLGNVRDGTLDLVSIDPVSAPLFGKRGILVPVEEYASTPNLRHLDERWVQSCGDYSTPYFWGTMGLVYRRDVLPEAPDSWKALLQPSEGLSGHIGLVDNYVDTLAPSMFMRGTSINTDDEAVLSTVYDEMRALLPQILTFDYALSFAARDPRADQLYLALAYSGDQHELNAIMGTDTWEYVVPQEGTALWTDCLAVLSGSSRKALAMDFLNFINTPDVAAENSLALGIASPNSAAVALQPEPFRTDPLIYPDAKMQTLFQQYDRDISLSNIMVRNRITSALVNLHEAQ